MESGTGKGRVIARTRVRRAWLVSAVLLVTIATVAAAATVAPSPARTSRTVVVGGDDRYPPFQFVDAEHQPQGFDIEVARAVLQPQGWSVRFELGGWDKALDKLDRGEVDVVPMFMSEDRDKRFKISSSGKRKQREDIAAPAIDPGADAWQKGMVYQIEDPSTTPPDDSSPSIIAGH